MFIILNFTNGITFPDIPDALISEVTTICCDADFKKVSDVVEGNQIVHTYLLNAVKEPKNKFLIINALSSCDETAELRKLAALHQTKTYCVKGVSLMSCESDNKKPITIKALFKLWFDVKSSYY